MPDSLERIYRAVPTVQCKGMCQQACGPIDMSAEERRRIDAGGIHIPTMRELNDSITERGSMDCPALVDGKCSVYDDRPLICRLWGAVESMPCPHDCEVTPGLLMDEGAQTLIGRSLKLDQVQKAKHVTPDGVVSQHVSTKIERESESGPGGAGNTVTPGLTTAKEWL